MKRANMPSLEEVCAVLEMPDIVGAEKGSVPHSIGLVLLFSAYVGENAEQLEIMTALPSAVVSCIIELLKKNGVFAAGLDHWEDYWTNRDGAGITLNCDIACGQNLLKRGVLMGEPSWVMTQDGCSYVESLIKKNPDAKIFMEELNANFCKAEAAYKGNQKRKIRKGKN